MEIDDLTVQNPWWKDSRSINEDRYIKEYEGLKYPWEPRIKHLFTWNRDYVYTLRGPRQVGKTTLTKIFIKSLLQKGTDPVRILYYTCDIVEDKKELTQLLETYLDWARGLSEDRLYIFLDEISSVQNWQDSIKILKDTNRLENTTILLTGSHSQDIKKSGEMLPGRRRGTISDEPKTTLNKVLVPMKFAEFLDTEGSFQPPRPRKRRIRTILDIFSGETPPLVRRLQPHLRDLNKKLNHYLITGGFPAPINSYLENTEIGYTLYELYTRSVLGDMYKYERREDFLREISRRLIEVMTTRVGWKTVIKGTHIQHHETAKVYIQALRDSFVVSIVHKCDLNKKMQTSGYKKIYFSDPHIFHSFRGWVEGIADPFKQAKQYLSKPENKSNLIESVICDHLTRLAYNLQPSDIFNPENSLFIWYDSKEIDFLFKYKKKLWPVEVAYQENPEKKTEWMKRRFGTPVIISKKTLDINEDRAIIPASIFLCLV